MESLRDRFVALLSQKPKSAGDLPPVVPDELARGVLRWGMPEGAWHMLFHVREDAIVHWNVRTATDSARAELTDAQVEQYTSFLAGISAAELAATSPKHPLVFVPRAVVAPFDGFAVAHPSLAPYRPINDDRSVEALTFTVFPCFASEIPEPVDRDWMKLQLAHIEWSDAARGPASAFRTGKPAGKAKTRAKPARKPARPRNLRGVASGFRLARNAVEIENWRGHLLHVEDGVAATTDARVAVAGRAHLQALLVAFVERDALPTDAGQPDPLPAPKVWDLLEATAGDVVDGVEPVSFEERATGRVVARLWVTQKERALDIAFTIDDPRVTPEVLDAAIVDPYLRVLTRHHYRGKVDVLRVFAKDGPRDVRELAYPAK